MRAIPCAEAVWLGNLIRYPNDEKNGVMSTDGIVGAPGVVDAVPWALIVVPWGIEAMRAKV